MRVGRLSVAGAVAMGFLLGACARERPIVTSEEWPAHSKAFGDSQSELHRQMVDRVMKRLHDRVVDARAKGAEPVADMLALSGGGDWGAFGAGFLVGWKDVQQPRMQRPDFDFVTGVSTGALIAPFAFIGSDESYERVETLYRNPGADWARLRDWFVWLPGRPSFMEIPGLERELRATFNDEMVHQIATRSAEGRVLMVGTTNLDYGRQTNMDVGKAAERAIADGEGADKLLSLLLASSSIPAAFPAVNIDDGLYSDGGVTANILLRAEYADPNSFVQRWRREYPDTPMPRIRYWVIINNYLDAPPATVQPNWSAVALAALSASIRSATWFQTRLVAAQMDYMNAVGWGEWELRVVHIPSEWTPKVPGQFKKEAMNDLADVGRRLGADSSSWTLMTLPIPEEPRKSGH